jgi:hypothetical protein
MVEIEIGIEIEIEIQNPVDRGSGDRIQRGQGTRDTEEQ